MGNTKELLDRIESAQRRLGDVFEKYDDIAFKNQSKVLDAFRRVGVETRHFSPTSGYGYDDAGRDTLCRIFAEVFGSEDALVRPQFASATHALAACLFALTRPGDSILGITGAPYDTLGDVIGSAEDTTNKGSLYDYGISFENIPLLPDGSIDLAQAEGILKSKKIRLIHIQRSRGYEWRKSITIAQIAQAIKLVKSVSPDTLVMVDNCYGEFTEELEPTNVGADAAVGSLIKNPGGGIAPTGAYIAGTKKVVEMIGYRLTAPGIGNEVGSYAASYRPFYQGIFLAPKVVSDSLKGMSLFAAVLEELGYKVSPSAADMRSDIIQSIEFGDAQKLIDFCVAIQYASPVDAKYAPEPLAMPGYNDEVIMAAGTFVQGASLELSADAPIKPPYRAYLQGGLTFEHCKYALLEVLKTI